MASRLYYVDDSGAPSTGWVIYSWVEVDIADWSRVTAAWLDFRTSLHLEFGIPADSELHATHFLMGRGGHADTARHKVARQRSAIYRRTLATIRDLPGIDFGAVYRSTGASRRDYATAKYEVYRELVNRLNARLTLTDDCGLIVIDGNGTDPGFRPAHRGLDRLARRVVEDPFFHAAHANPMIQIADVVAYTAYLALARTPRREFAWDWYREHLSETDPREV